MAVAREWFTTWELQRLPGVPRYWSNVWRKAQMEGWKRRPHPRRRRAFEYHVSCLPQAAIEALMERGLLAGEANAQIVSEETGRTVAEEQDAQERRRRRHRPCQITRDPELRDFIVGLIAGHPHIAAPRIREAIEARFGRSVHIRAIQRFVRRWRTENDATFEAVRNPDRFKSRRMPAFGRADAGIHRLNQVWELDATPADVLLEEGRYQIVGCIDVWSRRARLLVVKSSRSAAVASLLRRCMLEWGVPEAIRTDQGKDFTSRHIRRALESLEIGHLLCPPYQPQQKPFIERFFRSFSHDIVELLPGYVGHDIAEREALRARRSFAEQLMRRGRTVELKLRAEEFQAICDQWCEAYHMRPHKGLGGNTPLLRASSWRRLVRRIENERALDILLAEAPDGHGIRVVQKQGVSVGGRWYIAGALGPRVRERVRVLMDPADRDRVQVFSADGENFICTAVAHDILGSDEARTIARQARAQWRQEHGAAKRSVRKLARKAKSDRVAGEILDDLAARARKVTPLARPGEAHETPHLRAAAEATAEKPEELPADPELVERIRAQMRGVPQEKARVGTGPDGRPTGADVDDFDLALWMIAHPDRLDEVDRQWLREQVAMSHFRMRAEIRGLEIPDWARLPRRRVS